MSQVQLTALYPLFGGIKDSYKNVYKNKWKKKKLLKLSKKIVNVIERIPSSSLQNRDIFHSLYQTCMELNHRTLLTGSNCQYDWHGLQYFDVIGGVGCNQINQKNSQEIHFFNKYIFKPLDKNIKKQYRFFFFFQMRNWQYQLLYICWLDNLLHTTMLVNNVSFYEKRTLDLPNLSDF